MNIDVVIVTFNRLEKLKKTLSCYDKQSACFRNLIVVNNSSSDGTKDYLDHWRMKHSRYTKYVIHTEENIGGAGGFYLGEQLSLSLNPDWIFVADDDAYPDESLFELFASKIPKYQSQRTISAICTKVLNPDGSVALSHRSRYKQSTPTCFDWYEVPLLEYSKEYFFVDFLSYVGSFLCAEALKEVGLVDKSFFIYNDDSEHSLRLRKYGEIICFPELSVVHDIKQVAQLQSQSNIDEKIVFWGDYYSVRNEMVMFRRHFPYLAKARLKSAIKKHIRGKDRSLNQKLIWAAVRDAWIGRMGKSKTYYPGWISSE